MSNTESEQRKGCKPLMAWLIGVAMGAGVVSFVPPGISFNTDNSLSEETARALEAKITDLGFEVINRFTLADQGNMQAYAVAHQDRTLLLYAVPGGEALIFGEMVDTQGNSLSQLQRAEHVDSARADKAWESSEAEAHWIEEGSADAPAVMYSYTDPLCSHCQEFWQTTRELAASGQIRIRHIPVAVVSRDSLETASAILGSDNPSSVFDQYMASQHDDGRFVLAPASDAAREQVKANNKLFMTIGARGTPTSIIKREDGKVVLIEGGMSAQALRQAAGID